MALQGLEDEKRLEVEIYDQPDGTLRVMWKHIDCHPIQLIGVYKSDEEALEAAGIAQ